MECTMCHAPIPDDVKYIVVKQVGLNIEMQVGCAHYRPDMRGVVATLGCSHCAIEWFFDWLCSLTCRHGDTHSQNVH
jgi:hypothetical protein